MKQPKDLNSWKLLKNNVKDKKASIVKQFSTTHLKIEIQHQCFDEDVKELFNSLLEEQEFFKAKEHFKSKQSFGDLFPYYMHLRDMSSSRCKEPNAVQESLAWMQSYVENIRQGKMTGYSGKAFTDVVNIGMGGSDLGSKLTISALEQFKTTPIKFHFISDADDYAFHSCLDNLNPETTLFIISSKSFETQETLNNAKKALDWCKNKEALQAQFIAITAYPEKAQALGYYHIGAIQNWVTGRFSCCSAINLILAIQLGFDGFIEFLKGAYEVDQHFLQQPLAENAVLWLAIIGLWNINFLDIPSQLLLMYDARLRYFVDYVQQMDMESNGKTVDKLNQLIDYATGPIVWGGLGNHAHHSYFQLLLQGSHEIAVDFISVETENPTLMNELCESRKSILRNGTKDSSSARDSIRPKLSTNHVYLKNITPAALGSLIALYENKIFTQAWLWNIHPFDQPGVEVAKQIHVQKNI